MQQLQLKYDDLEAKARDIGLLDLLAVRNQIQLEEMRLASVQAQVTTTQSDLDTARSQLKDVRQQILGAEDIVQLESFVLYEPKYQFTNSIDYKNRLDEIRAEQKQTARGLNCWTFEHERYGECAAHPRVNTVFLQRLIPYLASNSLVKSFKSRLSSVSA